MSKIEIKFDKGVRCDIIACSGINLSGRRELLRVFPTGSKKGKVEVEDLRSCVVRAPPGTRVVMITHPGPDWQKYPWRCIQVLEGQMNNSPEPKGLPGVIVPDLDRQDPYSARMADHGTEMSYLMAETLEDGAGHWTFGRVGAIKGRVQEIRIDRPSNTLQKVGMVGVYLVADTHHVDEARSLLAQLAEHANNYQRCERADAWMTRDRPGQFTFFAEFTSEGACEEMQFSSRYLQIGEALRPLLDREPSILLVDSVD